MKTAAALILCLGCAAASEERRRRPDYLRSRCHRLLELTFAADSTLSF